MNRGWKPLLRMILENRGWKPLLRMILERINIKWDSCGSNPCLLNPKTEDDGPNLAPRDIQLRIGHVLVSYIRRTGIPISQVALE